jgi:hypothetical protein
LARTFDDRYFMASTELNLLNTLLFVDDSSTGKNDHVSALDVLNTELPCLQRG